MLNRFEKTFLSVTVFAVMGVSGALGQAPQKKVKDQAEYDLYTNSTKETDPNKRLTYLNSWKEKYPNSDFKEERGIIYLTTYQQLNQPAKMIEAAKDILTINPKDVNALMWLAYFGPNFPQPPTADSLATGEKAAQGLLDVPRPETIKEDVWGKAKVDLQAVAHNSLAGIAIVRKQYDVAEKEYAATLKSITNPPCQSQLPTCPNPGQTSYALANAIIQQKKPERYPDALYELARAASMTGPGAMPDGAKKSAEAYLQKVYAAFHGQDDAGLKDLRALATGASPLPPEGFKIQNKNEIEAAKQEAFAKANPALAMWKAIKDSLVAEGDAYFDKIKGALIPGGANGVSKFTGKLVSTKPALNPKELVLAISDATTPEVTLKLVEGTLHGKADPGTEIGFEGIPSAFTKDPFMLTFDVESKDKVEGWPVQAAPPARKRAPVHKK